jgi:hypothetical protein
MPDRIPTPGIKTPAVRKSSAAQKPASYLGNVAKEVKQFGTAFNAATQKPTTPQSYVEARGQLAGAILQGRRYDSSGKQIKK